MGEILLCLFIFAGKCLEIILYTIRTVLSTRNLKGWVTFFGLLNNSIGIAVTIFVVDGITSNPERLICYALGESVGVYLGMLLDKKLALGNNIMTIIVNKGIMERIIRRLSENGFHVTYMIGKGYKEDRAILKTYIDRKQESKVKNILAEEEAHAVIFESKILNINES